MRNPTLRVLLAFVLTAVTGLTLAPPAAGHPYCGQAWGSLDEGIEGPVSGDVTGVRAGRHACFDRLVLDVDVPLAGWSVRYVDEVRQDGSGEVAPVQGGARLQVRARAGVVRTDTWFLADELVDTSRYRTFRDVQWAGTFENLTTIGVGVRARLPFRAFVLPGPGDGSRLVVDVAHRWCAPGHTC